MVRAVCPGSFDPVTHGHLDVIGRAAALVDDLIVAVGHNVAKNALFSPDERVELLEQATTAWPNVSVTLFDGLLVDFCAAHQAQVIVKGLRCGDFDYELPMAQMNHHLNDIETMFLPTHTTWSFVSSSLVREIATLGGDISDFVPAPVATRITSRLFERNREQAGTVGDL